MEALRARWCTWLDCSLHFLPRLLPSILPFGTFIAICDPSPKSRRSIRQHTLAYVSIRQHMKKIRQHTSAYVSTSKATREIEACLAASVAEHTSAELRHTSAYVSIRQHTIGIRQHT